MATLAMFSGGIDSTAMLVKLLADPREELHDELHVHHIRMANKEGRDGAESRAVEAILGYLRRRYRPFRYSESALDFTQLEAIPIDYLSIAYVACQVAIDTPGCTRIAVGSLAQDTDIVNRSARQKRVFDEMYACYRARKLGEPQVEWIYPVYNLRKPEVAALLPPELLEMTWSCRRPVAVPGGYRPCQACKACAVRADLQGASLAPQNLAS